MIHAHTAALPHPCDRKHPRRSKMPATPSKSATPSSGDGASKCVGCEGLECFVPSQWNAVLETTEVGGHSCRASDPTGSPTPTKDCAFSVLFSNSGGWDEGGPLRDPCVRMVLHGVPADMRKEVWPRFLGVAALKQSYSSSLWERALSGEGVDDDTRSRIERDLHRTFPQAACFREDGGTDGLKRVLTACASFDPKVGYTQGMAFSAAMFLMHGISEEDSFWCMTALALSEPWAMRGIWAPELDNGVAWGTVRRKIWDVVRAKIPDFARWAGDDEEMPDMLFLPFLPSLFCNRMSVDVAARVLDAFYLLGWNCLVSLTVTVLTRMWTALDPHSVPDTQLIPPTILPMMFNDCRDNAVVLLEKAWRELLPDSPPPCSSPSLAATPSMLRDADIYRQYIVI